ncbi:MAG: hypothetical protein A3J38_00075 [Gammaproteobacteria bacterium RIFCSPHIGHO2_12_FULL_45_9]|nr:MAG: hypothetical protein A3J38_00075 [Gammaproteobacteria bacterium RIFCSPHIGHO2_12_FULL_45_9]
MGFSMLMLSVTAVAFATEGALSQVVSGCGKLLTCDAPTPCGTQCCPATYPYLNNCDCHCYRDAKVATKTCAELTVCRKRPE